MTPLVMTFPLLLLSVLPFLTVSARVLVSAEDCSDFTAAACPLTEDNIIGFHSDQQLVSCQKKCLHNSGCNWFTHYEDKCWELGSCDAFDECKDCVSGPPLSPYNRGVSLAPCINHHHHHHYYYHNHNIQQL